MLLSMTGFGDARTQHEPWNIEVEVRTVNNRYLKISAKCPDTYAGLENEVEKTVRESIARGTVLVVVRVDRVGSEERYMLNRSVLGGYWRQLNDLAQSIQATPPKDLSSLLELPGVLVEEDDQSADTQADWSLIRDVLREALEKLQVFRASDGRLMEQDLRDNCAIIAEQLERIARIAPQVVRDYRDRLHEKVAELLAETDVSVDSADLIREVSVFAERCDINEEITRLRSHLDQFQTFLTAETSQGRKLEFLSQEMFREVNTIGSKANNVEIAHMVVEMKAAVEKMREILQNVE